MSDRRTIPPSLLQRVAAEVPTKVAHAAFIIAELVDCPVPACAALRGVMCDPPVPDHLCHPDRYRLAIAVDTQRQMALAEEWAEPRRPAGYAGPLGLWIAHEPTTHAERQPTREPGAARRRRAW